MIGRISLMNQHGKQNLANKQNVYTIKGKYKISGIICDALRNLVPFIQFKSVTLLN